MNTWSGLERGFGVYVNDVTPEKSTELQDPPVEGRSQLVLLVSREEILFIMVRLRILHAET